MRRVLSTAVLLVVCVPFAVAQEGILPAGRRWQAAQPRLRDRHAQGLDRRRRRLQGSADQGRHRLPAPQRQQVAAPGPILDRRLREATATSRPARSPASRSRSRIAGRASSSAAGRGRRRASNCSRKARSFHSRLGHRSRGHAARGRRSHQVHGQGDSVRIVDEHTGHWGHINFDDFRFHQDKPKFPAAAEEGPPPPLDKIKNAGLKPEEAAAAMTVPEDFNVTLFAGEPDVHQPIAFCHRRSRPAVGRGVLHLSEAHAVRRAAAAGSRAQEGRPHPDLRGHRRRRQVRQEDRLHRRA